MSINREKMRRIILFLTLLLLLTGCVSAPHLKLKIRSDFHKNTEVGVSLESEIKRQKGK